MFYVTIYMHGLSRTGKIRERVAGHVCVREACNVNRFSEPGGQVESRRPRITGHILSQSSWERKVKISEECHEWIN